MDQEKIARTRNTSYLLATLTSLAIIGGCDLLNPDRHLVTRDGPPSRVVDDSPEVERLFSVQKARDAEVDYFWQEGHSQEDGMKRIEDIHRHPERYTPGRKEFLLAMSLQPGVFVRGKTYVRHLESSGAKCELYPEVTATYIKVRITSGPLHGREGWVCEGNLFRTVALP